MTARHQIRVGGRRLGRDRGGPIDAQPAPTVGELLRAARESKGVDIFRAERDTKIRAKHLESLENGDYGSLPGAVYTKGFLRNYAAYLGLDPEDIIERWREETSTTRRSEAVVVAPPRAIAEPRGGLTFTRNVIFGALLSVIVIAFLGYVVLQVVRFNQSATVSVDGPLVLTLAEDAETHVITGQTLGGATITVTGPLDFHAETTADSAGRWSVEVPVTKGRTDFTITARDPATGRDSEPVMMILTVPVPATPSPGPTSSTPATAGPSPTAPPGLPFVNVVLTEPLDGAIVDGGSVTVAGTTDATRVTISAAYVGPPTPAPSASPDPSATATIPAASPTVAPTEPPAPTPPAPVDATIIEGAFSQVVELPPGRWQIGVTAMAADHTTTVVTRSVEVPALPEGVSVLVEIKGGDAWMVGYEDGRRKRGVPGRIYHDGETLSLFGLESVTVRTGLSSNTYFTVNGEDLGTLGGSVIQTWTFERGQPPRQGY